MVNAVDLRSAFRKDLRVRVPPPAQQTNELGAKHLVICFVGERGLEPPCLATPAPKAGASTNFATRPNNHLSTRYRILGVRVRRRNASKLSIAELTCPPGRSRTYNQLLKRELLYH